MADLASALLAGTRKRKFHEILAQEAASTAPTPSWGAAIARALQGGMAGLIERNERNSDGAEFDRLFGPQQQPVMQQSEQPTERPSVAMALAKPDRVYSENEFNPMDAKVATQQELAHGVPQMVPPQYRSLMGKAAVDSDIPVDLLARQTKQESGFKPNVVSPAGAQGISQFMPGTAREMGINPNDPQQAIPAQAAYLRQNIDKFGGSTPLGLAAYNWGPGNVQKWLAGGGDVSKMPAETQGYIRNIAGAQPDALPPGAQPTQGQMPQQMAQASPQGQTRVAPQIPPHILGQARKLWQEGDRAAAGALMQPYLTPKDQWEPLTDPAARAKAGISPTDTNPYHRNTGTNEVKAINPQPFKVDINQQGQSEFEKEYGRGISKQALEVVERGNSAAVQKQRVMLAQKMMEDISTGKLAPAASTVGGYMQAMGLNPQILGIDPKTPMTAEALSAITSELVIGKIGSGGFPANNFSNPDREFLVQGVFKLADRPEANFIKLEVAKRVAALDEQKADAWTEARANGESYEKFDRAWRKQLGSQNIFGDLIEQAKAFGEKKAAAGSQPTAQPSVDDLVKKYAK